MNAPLIANALQAYRRGNLFEAEWLCQRILQQQAHHLPTHHLLGAIAYQTGRLVSAIEHYQIVLQVDPNHAEAHSNLAVALQDQGDWQTAEQHFLRSRTLNPNHAPTEFNLGNLRLKQRDYDGAIAHYLRAITLNPNYAKAYNNLGNVLREQGQLEGAIAHYRQAIALEPNYVQAHNNLGNVLQQQGHLDAAIAQYHQSLALQPAAEVYYNLGNALREQVHLDAAIQAYQQALALDANRAAVHNNLGLCFQEQNQLETAIASFRQAIALDPDHVEAHTNLGVVLYEQGQLTDAAHHCERAIALNPQAAAAHVNLSFALLASGELQRGFAEYEWRWQYEVFEARLTEQSRWDGSDLTGKTLLLYAELGLGDVIHFIRYVPLVAQRAARVIVDCRPELMRLLSTVPGIDEFVLRGAERPPFDLYSPLMSLPHLLADTLDTIPRSVPYLSAIAPTFDLPGRTSGNLHIGITWASGIPTNYGNQEFYRRYLRSYNSRTATLSAFMALRAVPNVKLYSLQVGEHVADIAQSEFEPALYDLSPQLTDLADTAAAIAQLDLVISVDTAVVHIAGALAKPVWVLLPTAPDWRWMRSRDDSPWYPTMRLFHQDHPGDWEGVMAKVVLALQETTLFNVSSTNVAWRLKPQL